MNYEWKQDKQEANMLTCEGAMYSLEIQEDNGVIFGSVWREIPATFWETSDVECIIEREYASIEAAKLGLAIIDKEALDDQLAWEASMEEQFEEQEQN